MKNKDFRGFLIGEFGCKNEKLKGIKLHRDKIIKYSKLDKLKFMN